MKDPQQERRGSTRGPIRSMRSRLLRRECRRLPFLVLAALLSLGLWGCGSAEQTPASEPSEPKPPPVAAQSMAAPETGNPIEDLKKFVTPERAKLGGAGAAVLLVTFMVGVGVGKSRKEPEAS